MICRSIFLTERPGMLNAKLPGSVCSNSLRVLDTVSPRVMLAPSSTMPFKAELSQLPNIEKTDWYSQLK